MCTNQPVPCDCDTPAMLALRQALREYCAPNVVQFGYTDSTGFWAQSGGHKTDRHDTASAALTELRTQVGA